MALLNFYEEDKAGWNLVLTGQSGPRFIKHNIPTESTCNGETIKSDSPTLRKETNLDLSQVKMYF